jgi:hypothetical protein
MWVMVGEVRDRLLTGLKPDGFNIGFNDGLAAGQTVLHAHVHVIPRRKGDVPDPRGGIRWVIADNAPYWKNPRATKAAVLQQNTDRQAAIVNIVAEARASYGDSLAAAMRDVRAWTRIVRKVARVVRVMPLWRLQRIGREEVDFLYRHHGDGHTIRLRPGVAFGFRKFHALISDLVRGAWVRYVRQQNLDVLGESADLNEFLFGSERNNPAVVRPVLLDLQRGRCFYCRRAIARDGAHVDHFVAWARYPVDFWHNFVVADARCNNQKRERLPACEHLATWTERNAQYGDQLTAELTKRGVVADVGASNRVAQWAYGLTEAAARLTWLRGDDMVPLGTEWRRYLA